MTGNYFTIFDLHTHTCFSDGRLTPWEVLEVAREKGYVVGIADHCGRGRFQLSTNRRFDDYLEALGRLPVLRSAELDLGNRGSVTPDRLARCDYLIAGVHSLGAIGEDIDGGGRRLDFFDPGAEPGDPGEIVERILTEIDDGARRHRFQVLAHPGLLPLGLRPRSSEILDERWDERLIALALEHGFALEISSRWELPGKGLIEKARRAGVRFSLGSDGHNRERMCRLDYSLAMLEECRIGSDGLLMPGLPQSPDGSLIPMTAPTVSSR